MYKKFCEKLEDGSGFTKKAEQFIQLYYNASGVALRIGYQGPKTFV